MKNIAIFASGSGTNAENIVRFFSQIGDIQVLMVISNKSDAFVLERARLLGVLSFAFSKKEFDESELILDTLRRFKIDYIVLAGFLLKVSRPILDAFPNRIINIHPALLPKYGGKGMYGSRVHEAVVANGEIESGITIHFANENYDEGSIIFQAKCPVLSTDSPDDVAEKVHALEYAHFPEVIEKVIKKNGKR